MTPGRPRPWQPLLTGEAADEAIAIAEEIAAALPTPPPAAAAPRAPAAAGSSPPDAVAGDEPAERDPSLADGSAGIAVFLAHLDAVHPGRGHAEQAMAHLDLAFDGLRRSPAPPWLFAGVAGVAWAYEHLRGRLAAADGEEGKDGEKGEDAGEDVARLIAELLARSPWDAPVDLVGGAAGLGVYALERGARPHGAECLALTVDRLAESAEHRADGMTWRSPPWPGAAAEHGGDAGEAGEYDLGLSHGVPGVLAFLGEAAERGSREARRLLPGAVRWLLAQRLPSGSPSVFPRRLAPHRAPTPTPLAWCYGDLGIALALLGCARRAAEPAWEEEALTLARAAARRPPPPGYPVEPGLCHGTAGVAHLFNRLHQATGDPLFADTARAWLARTLALRRPGTGLAAFAAWHLDDTGALVSHAEPGLRTGVAGVGLALLAAATPTVPAWDRVLLVALPA